VNASFSWVRPEPAGLFIEPAQCWVDPSSPVELALVTHGHADHARGGHARTLATAETLEIMALRHQTVSGVTSLDYGETRELDGGVSVTFQPAGHVLGSAQILLEFRGERVVVSGDYKRRFDPTCPPFRVTPCDLFITEATFGLPVFRHPPIEQEIARLLDARAAHPQRCVLVGAYALGKAQRMIAELRRAGYAEPIFLHGALERMCALYAGHGIDLGPLRPATSALRGELAGQIVMAPPAALNDRWARRLPDPVTAMASGWMQIRQRARQRNVDLPLVISDHADWTELTQTITDINPGETWITHGREEGLMR
jgi:putative mRNA 3-end processing factor